MASTSTSEETIVGDNVLNDLRHLLWGNDIKHEVFKRWTQGEHL